MANLLPLVDQAIPYALAQSLEGVSKHKIFVEFLNHLDEVNPVIADFIRNSIEDFQGETRWKIFLTAYGVYKLLENQAEVNDLEWIPTK